MFLFLLEWLLKSHRGRNKNSHRNSHGNIHRNRNKTETEQSQPHKQNQNQQQTQSKDSHTNSLFLFLIQVVWHLLFLFLFLFLFLCLIMCLFLTIERERMDSISSSQNFFPAASPSFPSLNTSYAPCLSSISTWRTKHRKTSHQKRVISYHVTTTANSTVRSPVLSHATDRYDLHP